MGNKMTKQVLFWATVIAVIVGVLQYISEITGNSVLTLGISTPIWMILLATFGLVAGIFITVNKGLDSNILIAVIAIAIASGSASIVPIAGALVTQIAKTVLVFILPVVLVAGLGKLAMK